LTGLPAPKFTGCLAQAAIAKNPLGTPLQAKDGSDNVKPYDATGAPRYLELDTHANPFGDPMPNSAGTGPNVILRWNDAAVAADAVDVEIHFHGNSGSPASGLMLRNKDALQHLDLSFRKRPTVAVTPKGRYCSGPTSAGNTYQWQDLHSAASMNCFISWVLENFAHTARQGKVPERGRFIMSAHSGGGNSLNSVIAFPAADQPIEVYFEDCMYFGTAQATKYVTDRLNTDAKAIAGKSCQEQRDYMSKTGGAMRNVWLTTPGSAAVKNTIDSLTLVQGKPKPGGFGDLIPWYQVEHVPAGWSHDDHALLGTVFLQDPTNVIVKKAPKDNQRNKLTSGSRLKPC